jgi:hypothetical protein
MDSYLETPAPFDPGARPSAVDAFDRAQAARRGFAGAALALDDRGLLAAAFGEPWILGVEQGIAAHLARELGGSGALLFAAEGALWIWVAGSLGEFSDRLHGVLAGLAQVEFAIPGAGSRRVTLSAGLASSQSAEPALDPRLRFEVLEGVAGEGLRVAMDSGGGRVTHSELYGFLQRGLEGREPRQLEAQARRVAELACAGVEVQGQVATPPPPAPVERPVAPSVVSTPTPAPPAPPIPVRSPEQVAQQTQLGGAVHTLLNGLRSGAAQLDLVERTLEAMVAERLAAERERASALADRRYGLQVDRLERRLGKLGRALEESEARVASRLVLGNLGAGAASAYRSVQGLDRRDAHFEHKRSLMAQIFSANLRLQQSDSARN